MSEKHSPLVIEDMPESSPGLQGPEHQPSRRRGWIWLVVLIVVGVAAYRFWPRGGTEAPAGSTAPGAGSGRRGAGGITPVVAVKATQGDIDVYIVDPGAVAPVYTVNVQSQSSGSLTQVVYNEGDRVRKGQELAEIDSRPYEVQLETAQAALGRDQANLDNA